MRWNYASVEERFMEKVQPDPNTGCWIWTGGISHLDYGVFYYGGRLVAAHRVSYILYRGPFDAKLHMDHLCRNHWCVNPEHLEPVTHAENVRRGIAPEVTRKRHINKTTCKQGHPRSGDNLRIYVGSSGRISRRCLECMRSVDRAQKAKRKAKLS